MTRVFCYYHKCWEDIATYTYGPKKSTASGLNTMCKEGVSNWTKQQRVAKQERSELLTKLGSGEVSIEGLPTVEAEIEAKRTSIVEHSLDLE